MIRSILAHARRRKRLAWVALTALTLGILLIPFAARVYALRDRHAVGPSWSFPSRMYSDGVLLTPGRLMPTGYLAAQLSVRGYRRTATPASSPGTWATAADGIHVCLRGFRDAAGPDGTGGPERIVVRIEEGYLVEVKRLGGVPAAAPPDLEHPPHLEPVLVSMLFDETRTRRSYVTLDRVPQSVQDAIVSSEDRRFFGHGGLDLRANLRALAANLKAHGVRQGGSTITQQLARGLFLGRERTLPRKMAEAAIATGLEILLTKQQILEMYLNSIYWGQAENYGIGGIAEAAQWYFDMPVESLRVVEGATLAAMIPSPNSLSPFEEPAKLLAKRNEVLDKMVETKKLDRGRADQAKLFPLTAQRGPRPLVRFPSYDSYVRQAIGDRLPKKAAEGWGLSIFTAMDLVWQIEAETELERGLAALGRGKLQAAFVALEPTTGAARAVVGGRDLAAGDFNRATQAKRQTGSAIKPIVYAAAFSGEGSAVSFTPASTVADTPRVFGRGRWSWSPRNFDGSYHPSVTLAKALASSLNVATTNVVDAIGPGAVARMAERFGLGRLKAVMSIGLGSNEVTLLSLTNAFAVFPSQGMRHQPSPILSVVDWRGKRLIQPSYEAVAVVPPAIAALMTGLLEDVVLYGVGYPLRAVYGFDRPIAGKTGTTNDFRDAWFVGFVPYLAAGVWVGYDRPRSIGLQAARSALPLWARIMRRMIGEFPPVPFATDSQLQWASIEPWSGYLSDSSCAGMNVPFLPGTAPNQTCTYATMDYGVYGENPDSLYADSTWERLPPDTATTRDTLVFEPPAGHEPEPIEPVEPAPDTLPDR